MRTGAAAASVCAALAAILAASVARAAPPPGATALCRDGTYSFSQHRSGTCSHHGGVARRLGGAPASAAAPTAGRSTLGRTVLLAPRTRTRGCTLGPLPDRRCSPGAYQAALTVAVLCASGFHTGAIRDVSVEEKHRVEAEYGLAPRAYGSSLELDHIVPLELGGSNVQANLFPERAPGYHVKDRLESRLRELVCTGRIELGAARRRIAANWEALYRQVLGTQP